MADPAAATSQRHLHLHLWAWSYPVCFISWG